MKNSNVFYLGDKCPYCTLSQLSFNIEKTLEAFNEEPEEEVETEEVVEEEILEEQGEE